LDQVAAIEVPLDLILKKARINLEKFDPSKIDIATSEKAH